MCTLMGKVRSAGIEPWALDGDPEAIQEPQRLADKVRRLLHLATSGLLAASSSTSNPISYRVSAGRGATSPVSQHHRDGERGHARSRQALHGDALWLATPTVGDGPQAYAVMDLADEVAVMSYRTDLDEVQDIADDILRYGSVSGIPVWLAVETTVLPVEQHVVLRRAPKPGHADALLDRDHHLLRWRPMDEPSKCRSASGVVPVHRRFTVRPEQLSFAGRAQSRCPRQFRRYCAPPRTPVLRGDDSRSRWIPRPRRITSGVSGRTGSSRMNDPRKWMNQRMSAAGLLAGSLLAAGWFSVPTTMIAAMAPDASPRQILQQAKAMEEEQRYEEAIAAYRQYLTARPDHDDVRATVAKLLSWQGQWMTPSPFTASF